MLYHQEEPTKRTMTTRGYEIKDIEKLDDGSLLITVIDFLKSREERIVLLNKDKERLREALK